MRRSPPAQNRRNNNCIVARELPMASKILLPFVPQAWSIKAGGSRPVSIIERGLVQGRHNTFEQVPFGHGVPGPCCCEPEWNISCGDTLANCILLARWPFLNDRRRSAITPVRRREGVAGGSWPLSIAAKAGPHRQEQGPARAGARTPALGVGVRCCPGTRMRSRLEVCRA